MQNIEGQAQYPVAPCFAEALGTVFHALCSSLRFPCPDATSSREAVLAHAVRTHTIVSISLVFSPDLKHVHSLDLIDGGHGPFPFSTQFPQTPTTAFPFVPLSLPEGVELVPPSLSKGLSLFHRH